LPLVKVQFDGSRDLGLLLLRVGIGLMFVIVHGLPQVLGGVSKWTSPRRRFQPHPRHYVHSGILGLHGHCC